MFERYTEKARRVIFFARYEASQCGASAIEPPHLLLGIMREDKYVMRHFIDASPDIIEKIRNNLKRRQEKGEPREEHIASNTELPLADGTKRALAHAHEAAEEMRHRHIGTEHLLIGLLRDETSEIRDILAEQGIDAKKVGEKIQGIERDTSDLRGAENIPLRDIKRWAEETRATGHRLIEMANRMSRVFSNNETEIEEMIEESKAHKISNEKRGAYGGGHRQKVVVGIEKLLEDQGKVLGSGRVGLVCNQASVDHGFRHVADLFREQREINLTTLFGPQHGIRGTVQDNMVETPHSFDRATGLPVYSLYSETREPTEEMLGEVDTIVCDMQDVGCRIYTFIYTMMNCMRAARKYKKRVVVCDRPNPINGLQVAGNVLERGHESFVGQFPLPTRHGMTPGELAKMFNEEIGCELEIVTMDGWTRELWMDETDAPWVIPSPNMPTIETTTVFPGTVHTEGTQLSEGRGTTRPFELTGAPYINAEEYSEVLNNYELPGVYFRACSFLPTFQKHGGETCEGVQIHVLERNEFEPVLAGLATIKAAHDLYPENFLWKNPPYEYEHERNPFDVIAGTKRLREQIEAKASLEAIKSSWQGELGEFMERREEFLLY
jgi:uncharacterized protein YbbC (DUF1343 family)